MASTSHSSSDGAIPSAGSGENYHAPHVQSYGPVSELTEAISGSTGCDGAYPSYTAS